MATPSRRQDVRGVPREPEALAMEQVSGNRVPGAMVASASIHRPNKKSNPKTDRGEIAKQWQIEAYRHVNICGEARYAATLFSALAGRAEIGVSEPTTLARKAVWIKDGIEVDVFAGIVPSVRARSKLIRDYMLHRTIAGECYLIARSRVDTDPGFEDDMSPLWEIVAVTELQKVGTQWRVRHDNGNYIDLSPEDPVIRMWNPDPADRREAWSPFRSLLPVLREIEWLTAHIFKQVRTRLMSAGVWFLPDNLTFPPPPPSAVEGGVEAMASMNEAELFMASLASSALQELDPDEASFPSIVMADPLALDAIDQKKLIKFWSEIDDKAMILRSDNVRRFALGMDLPPEQVLGSSGMAVGGQSSGSGSTNHWSIWADEERTISAHIEPALDDLVGVLTTAVLQSVVPGTAYVIAYDTATLRLRPDRSKEAIEWYDRGILKAEVALRETGFDPENDQMEDKEHKVWLLNRLVSGSASPEMMAAALALIGVDLPMTTVSGNEKPAPQLPDTANPSLEDHPYEGPPRVDHEHNDAPFSAQRAAEEVLILRALEKAGNRLLNDGRRGKDRDRTTPAHMAHIAMSVTEPPKFDFSLSSLVFPDLTASQRDEKERQLGALCSELYATGTGYTREVLLKRMGGL